MSDIHYARSVGVNSAGDGVYTACSSRVWEPNAWTIYWPDVTCATCLERAPEEEKLRRRAEWEKLTT
jgi:hypothetical protein